MKIKAIGRYALDMLRGQQQQVEKNQYEEHLDQLRKAQEKLAQRTTGGYISPYQNAAQFNAQAALGAINTQGMGRVFYGEKEAAALPTYLETGVWAAAISDLENLWLVRFGSKWVQSTDMDEFYSVACSRLLSAGKIETHNLPQLSMPVYRIIE